jgi:hypothetical protein
VSGLRLRFRKSFTLVPGVLKWTLTRRGASLNLHLLFYSKSWGRGGRRTTTIDAPGRFGLSWRKQRYVKPVPGEPSDGFAHFFQCLLVLLGFLIGLIRLHGAELFSSNCSLHGHPHYVLATITVAEILILNFRGFAGLVVVIGMTYLQWRLYGGLVGPSLHCGIVAPVSVPLPPLLVPLVP